MAVSLHQLLKTMTEMGGTDLHVTTNSAPQVRIDGKLRPLDLPSLTAVETKQLAYSVLTDAQKHRFEENLELDFSFGIKGLARFRANVFMQRGAVAAVYRTIPYEIRGFKELGLPPVVAAICDKPRGLVLVTGPDRLGQVHDARRDARQDQLRAPRAHAHGRGPDRVPAPAQEVRRQPARGRTPTRTRSRTRCARLCARTPTWC